MERAERFAVALTCIDGRIHDALRGWIHDRLDVDAIDLVTVQGPDHVLADGDGAWVDRLAERVRVSQRAHGSTQLILASHSDCAGHPVSDAEHHRDVERGATRLRPLLPGMHLTVVHIGRDGVVWTAVEVRAGGRVERGDPAVISNPSATAHGTGATAGDPELDPIGTALATWRACCTDGGWTPRGGVERVGVTEAVGRLTAGPVHAVWSSPADELAAMDGIAVRAADTTDAAADTPVRLAAATYDVVDTGDPLPPARDAVIMREHVRRGVAGTVEIVAAVPPGRHVRGIGEDVMSGELLLPAGHRIRPVDAAVAAGAGHTDLLVSARSVVAILPTGDEVRPIGSRIGRGEVLDTNSLMLAEQAREAGATPVVLPIVPDDPDALAAAIRDAADRADLVLVIAGSSKGRDDHTATVLAALGKVAVQGAAIRPGHPVVLGVIDAAAPVPVIGVPGYPVSAAHVFATFALPMLGLLGGGPPVDRRTVAAMLTRSITSPTHVEESVAVRLEQHPISDAILAVPIGRGAGALSVLMRADGLLRVPAGSTGLDEGSEVLIEQLPGAPEAQE